MHGVALTCGSLVNCRSRFGFLSILSPADCALTTCHHKKRQWNQPRKPLGHIYMLYMLPRSGLHKVTHRLQLRWGRLEAGERAFHVVAILFKHNCTFGHNLTHKMAITATVMKLNANRERRYAQRWKPWWLWLNKQCFGAFRKFCVHPALKIEKNINARGIHRSLTSTNSGASECVHTIIKIMTTSATGVFSLNQHPKMLKC